MKPTRIALSLALALCLMMTWLPAALAAEVPDEGNVLTTEALTKVSNAYPKDKPLETWLDVMALASAGVTLKTSGHTLPDLKQENLKKGVSAYASRILTLLALEENPRTYYKGLDLVPALASLQKTDGSFGYLNEDFYAILALEQTAPEGYNRKAALASVLSKQLPDGGYAFSGDKGDIDMTGMALMALACDKSDAAKAAVDKAVTFIQSVMTENGGFVSSWSETKSENACSAATVLSGLSAVGRQKSEQGLKILKNLLSYQLPNGTFANEPSGKADAFATQQAYMALGDYLASSSIFSRVLFTGDPYKAADLSKLYTDAASISPWAAFAVSFVSEKELMTGSNGKFNPRGDLKRSELAQLVYNMANRPSAFTVQSLTDVTSEKWYYKAVHYAVEKGLIDAEKGMFNPDKPASRQDVAAAIARLYKLDTESAMKKVNGGTVKIADFANVSVVYRPYVAAVFCEGIMVGNGTNFRPTQNITREEMAKLFATLYV